ncbi:hypothetical protein KGM_206309 [Danaus plexippus plexippus]|uniref:Uncharacterized protein n=1 Tax=Danaus plexippus plexippus TaxID=278856 RepID=A0A212F7J0_DANPL|nr:hypothetical protein KGM_206309 [Danaus plexippus plexippus]
MALQMQHFTKNISRRPTGLLLSILIKVKYISDQYIIIVCATLAVVRSGNLGYGNHPVSQYNQAASLDPRSLAYRNGHVNLGWNPSGAPQVAYSGYASPGPYAGSLASPNHVLHNSPLAYSGLISRPSNPLSHLNSPHVNPLYNVGSLGHSDLLPRAGALAHSASVSRGPLVHATSQVNAVSLFQSSPLNYGGYVGHNQHMNDYYFQRDSSELRTQPPRLLRSTSSLVMDYLNI